MSHLVSKADTNSWLCCVISFLGPLRGKVYLSVYEPPMSHLVSRADTDPWLCCCYRDSDGPNRCSSRLAKSSAVEESSAPVVT